VPAHWRIVNPDEAAPAAKLSHAASFRELNSGSGIGEISEKFPKNTEKRITSVDNTMTPA
jgi:hypothetical protein